MIHVDITAIIKNTSRTIIILALLVLVGWQFEINILKTILPGFVSMNQLTAVGFIAISIWQLLWLKQLQSRNMAFYVVMVATALYLILTGGSRLLTVFAEAKYNIGDVFYTRLASNGRISPLTGFSFILFGTAMLLSGLVQRYKNLILLFVLPVFIVSTFSLFGLLIGNNDVLTQNPFMPMALHTSLCFLAFTICFLLLFSNNVITETLLADDYGGYIARKLLPYVVLVPICLGFLRYKGEKLGLYDTGFGVAIIVVELIIAFLVVVIKQSQQLSLIDRQRRIAENQVVQHSEEVVKTNKELELRNNELEQFTYVSHHDLQEPLRKIIMFSEMVKADSFDRLSEVSQKRLDKVLYAARRMSGALKDVLSYASLDKKELFAPQNLNDILTIVLNDLELLIAEKEAVITADALPTIRAIGHQMHQLFYNLLNNALKFAKPGCQPVITIKCVQLNKECLKQYPKLDQSQQYWKITVQDNGIGFEQEADNKIFAMFQRLHAKDVYAGTGIGLALCKKVVNNHNGFIKAEGKLGEGALFTVLLPVALSPVPSFHPETIAS